MDDPRFRLACTPGVLASAPPDWPSQLIREGNVALLPDRGGLDAIDEVARTLDLATVRLMRREPDTAAQEALVMRWAERMPLLWVAPSFGQPARDWAVKRGPMTLLVETDGPLDETERRRMDRFVAILGRQAE